MKTQNKFYDGQIRTSKNTSVNISKLLFYVNQIRLYFAGFFIILYN